MARVKLITYWCVSRAIDKEDDLLLNVKYSGKGLLTSFIIYSMGADSKIGIP